MPIDASPSGTLDIENATLRSRNIASLTNMVAGNDVIRGSAAPTLEVYGDPSHGGTEPTLELVSNTSNTVSTTFTRLTSNAGVFSIQSGTAGTTDSKGDIAFTSVGGDTEHMRIQGSTGNVGIGTDAPDATLDVRGSGQYNGIYSTRFYVRAVGDNSGDGTPDDNTGSPWYGLGYDNLAWNNQSHKYSGDIPILSGFSGVALRSGSGNLVLTDAGNVGIGTTAPKTNFGTPALEVYNGVIMSGERTTSNDNNYSLYVGKGSGGGWLTGYTATGSHVFAFYNTNPTGNWNGALSSFYINNQGTTGRSINASGTINASGSDYAEYIRKKDVDMVVNKGDILGLDSNAHITNIFSESVSFAVKSTDPCLIGGDTWGTQLDMYPPKQIQEIAVDASDEEKLVYESELHDYEIKYKLWKDSHENVRKLYDRVAFCGQVPVNIYNALPGQYIIPIKGENDTIGYELTATPTFDQYRLSLGKVIKILDDGRAWAIIKII